MNRQCFRICSRQLAFEKLEIRVVLDAGFQLTGTQLILDGWDTNETLTIREDGLSDRWAFELSNGVWVGADTPSAAGDGQSQLLVDKSIAPALVDGIHAAHADPQPGFQALFESADFSDLAGLLRLDALSVRQVEGSTVVIPRARFATDILLEGNENDFDTVFTDFGSASLRDRDDIQLAGAVNMQALHVVAGDAIQATPGAAIYVEETSSSTTATLSLVAGAAIDFSQVAVLAVRNLHFQSPQTVQFRLTEGGVNQPVETYILGDSRAADLQVHYLSGTLRLAAQSELLVSGDAEFEARDILLGDTAGSRLLIGGESRFSASNDLRLGRSVPVGTPVPVRFQGAARLSAGHDIAYQGNSLVLSVDAAGSAYIEERSALLLTGEVRAAQSLTLVADKAIVDQDVAELAATTFTAQGKFILLADSPYERLQVSGRAWLSATEGIYVGEPGLVDFGRLRFNTGGFADITEDGGTNLVQQNTADVLTIQASGLIQDSWSASVQVTHDLRLSADGIYLAQNPQNRWVAGGTASLVATQTIMVGMPELLTHPTPATVQFGELSFFSEGFVSINETDGMYLKGLVQAERMELRTLDYLLNAAGLQLFTTGISTFQAGSGIILGLNPSDRLTMETEAHFFSGGPVRIAAPATVTMANYYAFATVVDVHIDYGASHILVQQLNRHLPQGWSYQLQNEGADIRLRTFDTAGQEAYQFRFGSTGVISSLIDSRTGRNLLAPSYQGEVTDRVIQWSFWEVGRNAVYNHPQLPAHADRLNVTQAGTYENVLQDTVQVEMQTDAGQLKVWSINDRLWHGVLDPFMQCGITSLTQTQVLEGGGVLIRRVLRLGQAELLGQPVMIDSPYLVGWHPFSDSVFNSLAISIDSQGQPDLWWDDAQIPYFPDIGVDLTRGWAVVYNRDQLAETPTASVVFGTDQGQVHQSDGSLSETRYFNYNSMNFDGGMAINPGLATWQMPVGSIVDQYYLLLPGRGIDSQTAGRLDELAGQLPGPQVYHPGAVMDPELAMIVDRLSGLEHEPAYQTDHLGWLV